MKKPVILAIGHSRIVNNRVEGGAVSVGGISEHAYWSDVAPMVEKYLEDVRQPVQIIDSYQGAGYTEAMIWLGNQCRSLNALCVVELHFNSASPSANGHEWPYWQKSMRSLSLASALDCAFNEEFSGRIRARGVKPRIKPSTAAERANNRGWQFTYYTPCPAVIAEPFFGSNESDWEIAVEHKQRVAAAIACGILDWIEDESLAL